MSGNNNTPKTPAVQRREIARAEMQQYAGIGMFRYLLHSSYVRKGVFSDGIVAHSVIDLINVLQDSNDEPRRVWNDLKRRLIKDDPDIAENFRYISLPLWNDKNNRQRSTEVIDAGRLLIVVFELHTPLSNLIRKEFADTFARYGSQYSADIVFELERTVGWAGTMIRLDMQSIYEEGDYDDPVQPPGTPK